MKPIKLVIEGSFWDSQIYSGELLLLGDEGSMSIVKWADAIDEFSAQHEQLKTAVRVAFAHSDWFYTESSKKLLEDPAISSVVRSQLTDLAALPEKSFNQRSWGKHWAQENSPFSELPTDTDIYNNRIYAASDEGLFSSTRSGLLKKAEFQKHHDAKFLHVSASDGYKSIAAAAGDDGLFEFAVENEADAFKLKPTLLSKRSCTSCDWAFQSVVAWSASDAYFANFNEVKDKKTSRMTRNAGSVFQFNDIFSDSADAGGIFAPVENQFSWGSREKLYRSTHHGIEVTDYFGHGWVKKPGEKISKADIAKKPFTRRGTISSNIKPELILAAATAPFGAVIELEDRCVVIASDGEEYVYHGELVHWRVFPRSTHYSNQLHLIYEDRLEVISFVHDYFLNQKDKLAGFAK